MKIKQLVIDAQLHSELKNYAKDHGYVLYSLAEKIIKKFLEEKKHDNNKQP